MRLVRLTESCTVFISAPDVLPTLQQRAGAQRGEMITFSDADALRALDVITKRRPGLVVLERLFAATPRGTALINRIKADPTLEQAEIRVLSHDSEYARVLIAAESPGGEDLQPHRGLPSDVDHVCCLGQFECALHSPKEKLRMSLGAHRQIAGRLMRFLGRQNAYMKKRN